MLPLPDDLASLQERFLDGIKLACPGVRDRQIAAELRCDESLLSHARAGARTLPGFVGLVRLIRAFGSRAVLGQLAAIDGCVVVRRDALRVPAGQARDIAVQSVSGSASFVEGVHRALADGRIDEAEAAALNADLDALVERLTRRIQAGRAS